MRKTNFFPEVDVGSQGGKRESMSAELLAALDKAELLVKQIIIAGNQAALYTSSHPTVKQYVRKALETSAGILKGKASFCLSVREGLLVYENIPLYKVSVHSKKFIEILEEKKVGGIVIHRGLSNPEMVSLIDLLMASPGKVKHGRDMNEELAGRGVEHIRLISPVKEEEEETVTSRDAKALYKEASRLMREISRSIAARKKASMTGLNALIGQISESVMGKRRALLALTSIKDFDEDSYTHPVHVCILATALASLSIKSGEKLGQIGRAAILHDAGKALIPLEILNKSGPLDEKERGIVRRHPVDGARILEEADGVDPLSVVVAYEHHLGYNGDWASQSNQPACAGRQYVRRDDLRKGLSAAVRSCGRACGDGCRGRDGFRTTHS
jgi:hypothetical protein